MKIFISPEWISPVVKQTGTHLQVRPVDGFSRLMAQRRDSQNYVPFGCFVDIAPHFGVKYPPPKKNPIFG